MAKKAANPQTETQVAGPDPFQQFAKGANSAAAVSDAPWWAMEEDNKFYGKLLGMYQLNGTVKGAREYIQVQLMTPTSVWQGKGKDREPVQADAGDIINVGYKKGIDVFFSKYAPQVEAGATIEIGAEIGEKLDTKSGNSFWSMKQVLFKIKSGPTSAWQPVEIDPTGASSARPTKSGQASDDDTPF